MADRPAGEALRPAGTAGGAGARGCLLHRGSPDATEGPLGHRPETPRRIPPTISPTSSRTHLTAPIQDFAQRVPPQRRNPPIHPRPVRTRRAQNYPSGRCVRIPFAFGRGQGAPGGRPPRQRVLSSACNLACFTRPESPLFVLRAISPGSRVVPPVDRLALDCDSSFPSARTLPGSRQWGHAWLGGRFVQAEDAPPSGSEPSTLLKESTGATPGPLPHRKQEHRG